MIKYLGKYYNGPKGTRFISNFEMVKYYDDIKQDFLDVIIIYYGDGTEKWYIRPRYRDDAKDYEDKIEREKQLIECMKEQFKYIDLNRISGLALEEHKKYRYFLLYENKLNEVLRKQAIEEFGIDESILPEQLISINQLDSYNLEDLETMLDGTYGQEFTGRCL